MIKNNFDNFSMDILNKIDNFSENNFLIDNFSIKKDIELMEYDNFKEYKLGFISGDFGDGKTLFLAFYAAMQQKEYNKIYANFHLKKIKNAVYLDKISKEILFSLKENSLLLLQESYHYFDRRYCMNKENKELSHAIFQIRKKNLNILGDIPDLYFLDNRVFERGTFFIKANGQIITKDEKTKQKIKTGIFNYDVLEGNKLGNVAEFSIKKSFQLNGNLIYDYYDNKEMTTQEMNKKNEK